MAMTKRKWAHHMKRKAAPSLEGGASTGVRVNPATVKNPSWVTQQRGTPGYKPVVNMGPLKMSIGGKALKKKTKKKK